jgi:hypothetical protein
MISLAEIYGEKIFYRKKAYKNAKYIPFIAGIIFDFVLAYAIVEIFEIKWNYAFIKVYGLLLLYALVKPIVAWPIDKLNDKLFLKPAIVPEIEHYLRVFNMRLNDDNSGAYEDYLLSAAFDESQASKMQVLAAMTYAGVINIMDLNPSMDGIYYKAWCETVSKYIKDNREKALDKSGIE